MIEDDRQEAVMEVETSVNNEEKDEDEYEQDFGESGQEEQNNAAGEFY